MKRKNALLLLTALFGFTQGIHAQGTAFTYQGLLSENGARVNGTNDLQFTVHSTAGGNNPVGSPITMDDLAVSNGLFTVTLDFGAGIFNGSPRWLEISVRPGTNNGAFTVLNPRQAIPAAPYAVFAGGVHGSNIVGTITSNNLPSTMGLWSKNGAALYYRGGNVGIGTTNPASTLDVFDGVGQRGTVHVGGYQADGEPKLISFGDVDFVHVGENGTDDTMELKAARFFFTGGNVGIGTNNPVSKLSVASGNVNVANGNVSVANENHQFGLVDTDNAGKTWTLSTIQTGSGFGVYEDGATARLVVESGGKVTVDGGKAVVYNSVSTELMIHRLTGTITLNGLGANNGVNGTLTWGNRGFTAPPAVFAGDFQPGPTGLGDYDQIIVTPHSATTTGCLLRIFNAGNTTAFFTNGVYNIVVIGNR